MNDTARTAERATDGGTRELHKLRTLHLFAGAGGGLLADLLLGHQPVCAVEIEPYCQQVLSARQKDGILPWFPIFADVTEFDGKPWRGKVDVISGGFPCQDISAAGKGAGITGERSGLWSEFARIIDEVRPRYAFVENSPMLTSRGIGRVLGDLAEMGYYAEWCVLGAHLAGAPHRRNRIWIVANAKKLLRDGRDHNARISEQSQQIPKSGNSGRAEIVADALPPMERREQRESKAEGNVIPDAKQARLEGHGGNTGQPEVTESRNDCASVGDTNSVNGWPRTGRKDGEKTSHASWWTTEPEFC